MSSLPNIEIEKFIVKKVKKNKKNEKIDDDNVSETIPHIYDPIQITKKHPFLNNIQAKRESDKSVNITTANCHYCSLKFSTFLEWQVHSMLNYHKMPLERQSLKQNVKEDVLRCCMCKEDLELSFANMHSCYKTELEKYRTIVNEINKNNTGTPICCVLCRNLRVFSSQGLLQAHVLAMHSFYPNLYRLKCHLCGLVFKDNLLVLELHYIHVHAPQIDMELINFHRQSKAINRNNKMNIICKFNGCQEYFQDIYALILHTICYHGIPRFGGSNKISCGYCGKVLCDKDDVSTLIDSQVKSHVTQEHGLKLKLKSQLDHRRGLLNKTVSTDIFCIFCFKIFDNPRQLQVHIMIFHTYFENLKYNSNCGICSEPLYSYEKRPEDTWPDYPLELIYLSSLYHERKHTQQLNNYIKSNIWNPNLDSKPELYPNMEILSKRNKSMPCTPNGSLFTSEQYAYLKLLGKQNLQKQINFDILHLS